MQPDSFTSIVEKIEWIWSVWTWYRSWRYRSIMPYHIIE